MSKLNLPIRGHVYSLQEITHVLHLDDTPNLSFYNFGVRSVLQTSHFKMADLLVDEPNWGMTEWRYLFTTREWIPVFQLVSPTIELLSLVDVEEAIDPFGDDELGYWVVPKACPRVQYYRDPEVLERFRRDYPQLQHRLLPFAERRADGIIW